MHSPSGTRPKKRLACDRCHSRKLRCSGDLDGCSRCLGDDSVCTYSPALKVGRPSKASMAGREIQQTQSICDAAFYGISDGDALTADSGISMPPSPPQLGDSCITASATLTPRIRSSIYPWMKTRGLSRQAHLSLRTIPTSIHVYVQQMKQRMHPARSRDYRASSKSFYARDYRPLMRGALALNLDRRNT
ncbi:hypothetical protein FOQG_10139 [Fusarium oxysporum f. sp. raphani 54005]|uniref:Zn(2)-C6 fungal-type domain-containing protein n=2 Tax=Fusarium oxysporum TaxID=5507 RepID=X0CUC9_FUSOX|nr:hypothetical protein FOVG_10018 [Fusarium oxysporum f. sp. pisi HDV247]EXK86092.1 hypothetical protein FOQG_10139 [Fusarium oxysporum f. sp. raphani 54005]